MSNKSIHYFIFSLLLLTAVPSARSASPETPPSILNGTPDNDKCRIWSLHLGSGLGITSYQDQGTSPIVYKGPSLLPSAGIRMNGPRMNFYIESSTSIGIVKQSIKQNFDIDAFDVNNLLRIKFEWNVSDLSFDYNREPIGAIFFGISATNFLDVTVNPNYDNASAGVSNFLGPELSLKIDFWPSSAWDSRWLENKTIFFETSMMPLATVLRPGFAYIDNYTASQPVLNSLFTSYEWDTQPFAMSSTTLGLEMTTFSGTKVILSYQWSFCIADKLKSFSENTISRAFRHSTHLFSIDFVIPLISRKL